MKDFFFKSLYFIFSIIFLLLIVHLFQFSKNFLIQDRPPAVSENVDLIVALTGGQGRVSRSLDLLKGGKGSFLLLSGVHEDVSLKEVLKANNFSDLKETLMERILIDKVSKTTLENAVSVRKTLKEIQAESVFVVTSSYHLKRAVDAIVLELKKHEMLAQTKLYYEAVDSPNFNLKGWWKERRGWRIFLVEYMKHLKSQFSL